MGGPKDQIISHLEDEFNDGEAFEDHAVEALSRLRQQDLFALTKMIGRIVKRAVQKEREER